MQTYGVESALLVIDGVDYFVKQDRGIECHEVVEIRRVLWPLFSAQMDVTNYR